MIADVLRLLNFTELTTTNVSQPTPAKTYAWRHQSING